MLCRRIRESNRFNNIDQHFVEIHLCAPVRFLLLIFITPRIRPRNNQLLGITDLAHV
ncbi:hypothetical protein FQR65_LT07143 [Abscondita terminalis]|nr:hypothetical protein FQR65_LT07143 [Abscondita terminalis]